jgi:hypothetical protein
MRYVSASGRGFINGALVISRRSWEALPADVRQTLAGMARKNNDRVQHWMRQADRPVYRRLLGRGLTPVGLEDIERWNWAGKRLRESMVGRLYTRPLLRRVEAIIEKYENTARLRRRAPSTCATGTDASAWTKRPSDRSRSLHPNTTQARIMLISLWIFEKRAARPMIENFSSRFFSPGVLSVLRSLPRYKRSTP